MRKSLKFKLNLLIGLFLLIATSLIGIYSIIVVKENIIKSAIEKLKGDLELSYDLLDTKYPGAWSIKDGKMYKGDTIMNENFAVLDQIAEKTGDTVTIFQGNTRISTTVKTEDGKRAVGTEVSNEVADVVLKKGEIYLGEANVVGFINQTAYKPIQDQNGNIIGIWYVGVPNTPYDLIVKNIAWSISIMIILTLVIATVAFYIIISKGIRPLLEVEKVAYKVAEGDLKVEPVAIKSEDEIGRLGKSINVMTSHLREILEEVNENSLDVTTHSEELTQIAEEMSNAIMMISENAEGMARESAAGAQNSQEVSHVLSELASLIQLAQNKADNSSRNSINTLLVAQQGKDKVEETITKMNVIKQNTSETEKTLNELHQYIEQIQNIAVTINGISDQTNLLALNASIEAARAGEHGKGFAVVAEEVRKLAEQSNREVSEVNHLIEKITQSTLSSVSSMKESNQSVEEGQQIVMETGIALQNILDAVQQTVDEINGISELANKEVTISNQIVALIDQLTNAVETISANADEVAAATEQQTASMEEVSSSTQNLTDISNKLKSTVERFKI